MGQLMTSFRPVEDKAWNYVRPLPATTPYISMVPQGNDTFECVVLDGLPSKVRRAASCAPHVEHDTSNYSEFPNWCIYVGVVVPAQDSVARGNTPVLSTYT